jgi:hypothetical protein
MRLPGHDTEHGLYRAVLVRPVAAHAPQIWTFTKAEDRELGVSERKILRSIFGAVQDKVHWRRRRYNFALYEIGYMMC